MTSIASLFQGTLAQSGLSLSHFFRNAAENLFPEAEYIPDVLKCSAATKDRFIKQFLNNPHGNLRIFYFQLLRLCYMPSLVHTLPLINRLKKVILNPDFQILFSFDTQQKSGLFNNLQFKKLFAEFIDYLDYQEKPCIESAVNDYPIIDIVMIHIMRSLLVTKGINPDFNSKIETGAVFSELSGIFRLKLSNFKNYWVFEDSDFIVHAESEWELYISYKQPSSLQEKIKRRKYINGLLLTKSIANLETNTSIRNPEEPVKERPRFLSPPLSVKNVTSPKSSTFNKMFKPNLNFNASNTFRPDLNKKDQSKPRIVSINFKESNNSENKLVSKDRRPSKLQNYQPPNQNRQALRKAKNARSLTFFKGGLEKAMKPIKNINR